MAAKKATKKLGKKRVTAKVAGKSMCCTRIKGKTTYVCAPKKPGKKCRKSAPKRKAAKK